MVSTDKRQTQRNSVAMEKHGFMRSMDSLTKELKNVKEVCTDAHPQISALFNTGQYKDSGIQHSLDIWHGSKNAGQQKDCSLLLDWNKDICNHFWHCCKVSGNYEEFMNLWLGLLHHVADEHQWYLGSCQHDPLEGDRDKGWIAKGSVAH